MLVYYHGSDEKSIYNICNGGADISKGRGELGKGFYIGSSMWRACSWAWRKSKHSQSKCGVIEYKLDEIKFLGLNILCKNREAMLNLYRNLRKRNSTVFYESKHDAIWAPIVGKNIQNVYQIKLESKKGEVYINNQNKNVIWI